MDEAIAIRILLAKHNKSQSWLARQLGKSRPYVCNMYNGHEKPNVEMIKQICKVFDIKVSDFAKAGEE